MDYNLHIQKLLIQVDAETSPQNKVSLIKQAISLADLHNDIEWSFDLRIILFEEFKMPKLEDMMPAFVWLLDAFDNNPELFDEEELLWIYDWIIYVSSKDYNISLEQLNAMLDDYKNRLLRCGYSVRTYYKSKIALGFVIEDFDMIHENLTLRNQSVNDDMSSNEFDDLSDDISYYLQTGNIDKAIELFPEIKKLNTDTIHISSSYAEEITRCKRFDIIDQFITEAINDLSSTSKDDNLMVSTSAIAFALFNTDRIEEAWQYFERSLKWYNENEYYDILLWSLNTLPLLTQEGERRMLLDSGLPFYNTTNIYNINQLYQYFFEKASLWAQAYDKRNNNKYFSEQIEQISQLKNGL